MTPSEAADKFFDDRAVPAGSVSSVLAWCMVAVALLMGMVYGSEWAAKGFPYKPDMTAARRGEPESRVSPRSSPAALQRLYDKTRVPLQSWKE